MQKRYFHLLVVLVVVIFTSMVWAQRGPGSGVPRYDPKTETTVSGTIEDIQLLPGRHQWTGTHLILKTESGTIEVHVGPTAYIEKRQFSFTKGDRIEVLGSQVKVGSKDALLAREITKEGKKLILRDQDGVPSWSRRNRTN
ncbi:MAG: DNA-binding protein [Acidobacteriia bacterium]|nr:DNA-binding protein [Terriglobia bacterium]